MLRYKSSILPTLSLFFRSKNDIDVFIEDSEDEEFYRSLLSRLVMPKRIGKVISCKCKNELIKACEEDQSDRKRARVYLADGDLDLIFDANRSDLKYLYILPRYCIENFLLDEEVLLEVLHTNLVLEKTKIQKQLAYDNYMKSISHVLVELFLHYAITHKYRMGTKTVSISVGAYCKQHKSTTVLDFVKVEAKTQELRDEITLTIGEDAYVDEIYLLRQNWPSNAETLSRIVSAKDYLLPLIQFRVKKIKGKEPMSLRKESFRMALAKNVGLGPLHELKALIFNV